MEYQEIQTNNSIDKESYRIKFVNSTEKGFNKTIHNTIEININKNKVDYFYLINVFNDLKLVLNKQEIKKVFITKINNLTIWEKVKRSIFAAFENEDISITVINSGILYTSYLSKLKQLPENINKIIIMRYIPKWLDTNLYKNIYVDKSFAPLPEDLNQYHNDSDWDKFKNNFINQFSNRFELKTSLIKLQKYLLNGNDIILLCCEKDHLRCHRGLIGEYIQNNNISWIEI